MGKQKWKGMTLCGTTMCRTGKVKKNQGKWTAALLGALAAFCLIGCGNQEEFNNRMGDGTTESGNQTENQGFPENASLGENGVSAENENQMGDGITRTFMDEGYEVASYEPVQNFSYQLLKQNLHQSNPVLSPTSAYLAIGLAGLGSNGETQQEFDEVLGIFANHTSQNLMNKLPQEDEGIQVMIATSAWVDEELTPAKEWLEDATYFYDAEIFREKLATVETKDKINAWVEQETRGLIKSFQQEPLPQNVRLALFNTVYFHGYWEQPFDAYDTRQREFTTDSNEKLTVDMMQMYHEKQQYLKNDAVEGVILPYYGGTYSFVALKPVDDSSVREMYEQLDMAQIGELIDEKQDVYVNLQLPKFEITFDEVLNDSLENMGLKLAFDPDNADFSRIGTTLNGWNLYLNLVRQKAVIKVNEDGTEAAAVTEVCLAAKGGIMETEPPINVFFNRPFLYLIIENDTKTPLFMGILDHPQMEE